MVRRKPRQTALALLLAFLIGQVSELLICEASNLMLAIAHLAVGGLRRFSDSYPCDNLQLAPYFCLP